MTTKLPILQSGFIALSEDGLSRTEDINNMKMLRSLELGQPVDSAGNPFFYNRDVQSLFDRYNADHRVLKSFEFREELLKVVKLAFGTPFLNVWFEVQSSSPYLTALHRRFLDDTMKYIASGERDVDIESWLGLISAREATSLDKSRPVKTHEYFGKTGWLTENLSRNVAQWTGQNGGWNDLMFFMAIVFSKQSMKTL